MTVPVARTIGRYRVLGVLGQGAMGEVLRARDERLGRDVAIKRVKDVFGRLPAQFRARFEAEARALAALAHPGVVQVFDLGTDGDEPYLVMELVTGPSLRQVLDAQGALAPGEVRALGIQMARALEAAHARGIVHRDVKPGNILQAERGIWKLADFGIAHVPDSDVTVTGQFLGTPAYAAPESLAAGTFGPASDVFGLAATLVEAACGARPRGSQTATAVLTAPDQPIALEGVDPALAPALASALVFDPAARPSAGDLAALLAGATAATPGPSPSPAPAPAPSTPTTTRANRAWRGRSAAAGVIGLLVVGAVIASRWRAPDDATATASRAVGTGPPPSLADGPRFDKQGALQFATPPDLDRKGAHEWAKVAERVHDGSYADALDRLRDFEQRFGQSAESTRLRAWLEHATGGP